MNHSDINRSVLNSLFGLLDTDHFNVKSSSCDLSLNLSLASVETVVVPAATEILKVSEFKR